MNDIYVVGDVHGDFKKLIEALIASNWDEKTDKLIFVGDVVDRGIENAKVVNFIAPANAMVLQITRTISYSKKACSMGIPALQAGRAYLQNERRT